MNLIWSHNIIFIDWKFETPSNSMILFYRRWIRFHVCVFIVLFQSKYLNEKTRKADIFWTCDINFDLIHKTSSAKNALRNVARMDRFFFGEYSLLDNCLKITVDRIHLASVEGSSFLLMFQMSFVVYRRRFDYLRIFVRNRSCEFRGKSRSIQVHFRIFFYVCHDDSILDFHMKGIELLSLSRIRLHSK